jgi:predicted dienelactone hydrolase
MLLPHLPDMASLAGLESVPQGLWPSWADTRVDAIISMAGDAFFFGADGLANISVPVMAIGGTLDEDSPYQWSVQPTFEYVSSQRKVQIGLTEAEHMIFTGVCEKVPLYMKFFSGEFCDDQYWDRAYAHGLVKHFATAFLLTELQGDLRSSVALSSEAAQFSGMTYDAQGYE